MTERPLASRVRPILRAKPGWVANAYIHAGGWPYLSVLPADNADPQSRTWDAEADSCVRADVYFELDSLLIFAQVRAQPDSAGREPGIYARFVYDLPDMNFLVILREPSLTRGRLEEVLGRLIETQLSGFAKPERLTPEYTAVGQL